MSQQVTTPRTYGAISTIFADQPVEDLSEGIRSALATISILGGTFAVRYRKVRTELRTREIEVVILKGARTTSKAFWEGGYDGSDRTPDCWSSTGKTPDQNVPTLLDLLVLFAPNDVFTTQQNGMKSKPCGDGKRIAVVPAADIENDGYGGPMLLRIPAGSLGALELYGKDLKKLGAPFYAFTTIIRFADGVVTRLEFEPGKPLSDEQALIVLKHREDERTARIVNEELVPDTAEEAVAPTQQAPPAAAPPVANVRPVTPRVAPQAAPPAQPPAATGGFAVASKPSPAASTAQSPIGEALARPATPPPSQRVVQAPIEQVEAAESNVDDLFASIMNG